MRKLRQTDYLVVSANMINSPLMSKVHLDQGAYHPYLPAQNASTSAKILEEVVHDNATDVTSWDFQQHPNWTGPADYSLKHDETNANLSGVWLRMADDAMERTPAQGLEYATWGSGLTSWSVAAQSHLSLLENIRTETTNLYYHDLDEVWFTDYDRLSINLIAVWSNDVLDNLPMDTDNDDEHWLTVSLPTKLQKRVAVEMHALAAHFAFGNQLAVTTTDVLARYANYAHEKACLRVEQFGQHVFKG
ncbi:hypothetical protein H2198_001190 [Neophaeococcomyces mojaviensis]|uniref:Uncharacterized protein n=1 Tax=Neophaeococcomyces mojaviensis TaxID=3383035 RepID=A0ACC3AHJ4_9EURO|nr:hypothetical protein H2198_001190 [Knufia sp. JES_112]